MIMNRSSRFLLRFGVATFFWLAGCAGDDSSTDDAAGTTQGEGSTGGDSTAGMDDANPEGTAADDTGADTTGAPPDDGSTGTADAGSSGGSDGSGGSDSSGGSDGSGSSDGTTGEMVDCMACQSAAVQGPCADEVAGCQGDMVCNNFILCATPCGADQACVAACVKAAGGEVPALFDAISECVAVECPTC